MCARYETLPEGPEPFADYRLTWASPRLNETRSEMFPRYVGPVIRRREGELGLDAMAWGLIPFWAKEADRKKFRSCFNARAETVDTTASFRAPFKTRRCLVPAAAFMEFAAIEGAKVCHRVESADGKPLVFAGLWDCWRSGEEELYTYTIITAAAADGLLWLHHRMPVALSRSSQDAWLDTALGPHDAKALLVSPPPDSLRAVPA